MKSTFKIDELIFKNDSKKEQARTRNIFEILKDKAYKNEYLSEHEKDFFCQGLKHSTIDDEKLEDFPCCDNSKFKFMYLVYRHDLSGRAKYVKPKSGSIVELSASEVKKDIYYLYRKSTEWEKTISITNHSENLLQQISKEARTELNELKKEFGKPIFAKGKQEYHSARKSTLLHTKYIYCMALQIFEMFESTDFLLNLNGNEIEINEYSIIHILNRHFAQITKHNPTKSFHVDDFIPKQLNIQLKEIFKNIDKSGLYVGQSINKIAFKYKNIDYLIWIDKRTKSIKGKGNIEYNRLETFYPIDEVEVLDDLKSNYNCCQINDDLCIYVKK